ncbi:MAG: alpha/beta hydrolase [Planctomycetes bacterium]|nr:alpha/beta hydrolase [Planctomycetota bacterium]
MRSCVALSLLFATACSTVGDDLSRRFLKPDPRWLAEPADLGLVAEPFAIDVGSDASLTGWFIPHPAAAGRTVVLFHGNVSNASMLHPYYRFLHDGGLNVVVFDYRGYGKSRGEPTIRGVIHDTRHLLGWLHERKDVAADKIAWYGLSLGSVAALYAARTQGGCAALVLENIPGPRDNLRAGTGGDGALSAIQAGLIEFAGLPEGIEPDENIRDLTMPMLLLCGVDEGEVDFRVFLRTAAAARGPKQIHLLPGTGHAPHSLLTHDGQYQRRVVEFLTTALAGKPAGVDVQSRPVAGTENRHELTLTRLGHDDGTPWAVEIAAVDSSGNVTFHPTWLEGARANKTIELPAAPTMLGAMRVYDIVGTEDGGFVPQRTALSRSGEHQQALQIAIDSVRKENPSLGTCRFAAAKIEAATADAPFHPLLETELADVFAAIGRELFLAGGDDRAAGLTWLRRAIAAAPAQPKLHYWPGRPFTVGFPHEAAITRAMTLLRENGVGQ